MQYKIYKAKSILNIHKHIDAWFWSKYSAYPYVGCQFNCQYCYTYGSKYGKKHQKNPDDFSQIIYVKENAPELLRKELSVKTSSTSSTSEVSADFTSEVECALSTKH